MMMYQTKKMKDTKILKSTDESHNEKQRFKILLVCIIFWNQIFSFFIFIFSHKKRIYAQGKRKKKYRFVFFVKKKIIKKRERRNI